MGTTLRTVLRKPWIVAATVLLLAQLADISAQSTLVFYTLAGRPTRGSSDGAGGLAAFQNPSAIVVAPSGVTFIADTLNHTVRRLGSDGVVSTVAGIVGSPGSTNGIGAAARFSSPRAIAVDAVGIVYVADGNGVRRIAADGTVTTLTSRFSLAGHELRGLALDGTGNLFVAGTFAVWRIPTATGVPVVFAGVGSQASGLVDGVGGAARFNGLSGLTIDTSGTLFVTDTGNQRVRKITSDATVTTFAELPVSTTYGSGNYSIVVDAAGVLFVADAAAHQVLRVTQAGAVTVVAGLAGTSGSADGTGTAATFNGPQGIAITAAGTLYVADTGNSTIRAITSAGLVSTFAGVAGGAGNVEGLLNAARLNAPRGVAVSSAGTVYVADYNNCTIRAITPGGVTTTFAGAVAASQANACGSVNGTGPEAKFMFPSGVAVDSSGNVFVADTTNNVIRRITPAGVTTTFAGTFGTQGSDDGTGAAARFNVPQGLAINAQNTLYVADTGNHVIRAITSAGVVTTLAGTAGLTGSTEGTGGAARFLSPTGVAVDAAGTVYVADSGNHRIRKVTSAGVVTLLSGSSSGLTDSAGTTARFNSPQGVAVTAAGEVYVADTGNSAIRRVATDGVTSTVSATGVLAGYADGTAAGARFTSPYALAFDAAGNLYVSDSGNHAIRVGMVSAAAPAITTSPASVAVNEAGTATFTVAITGNLAPTIAWQVSSDAGTTWTTITNAAPYSGATTSTLTVTGVTRPLSGNRYRAVASNASGSATSTVATLSVNFVSTTPSAVRFGAVKAGSAGAITSVTGAQSVTVLFPGISSAWTATSNQSWAVVSNGTGNGNGQFTVTIANPDNVIAGSTSLTATITVTPSNSSLTAATVPVTLTINQTGATAQGPIGQVDSPAQNATAVVGAIALTGWVVDDVGIASVAVYRNCLPEELATLCQNGIVAGTPVVFVSNATFVVGARPDVEATFPAYAASNAAGWGLQVLTNMLPRTQGTYASHGGVGPVSLYVVATDVEGNRTLLGRNYTDPAPTPTTITMDNDNIASPFGTMDTPAAGATVSGSVSNFGWVLTPDANTSADSSDVLMPTNGSTIRVFVDGTAVGAATYNLCRGSVGTTVPSGLFCNDDIANIFGNASPQASLTTRTANVTRYRNLDAQRGAIGLYTLDTTGLTAGLHTLAWGVTDSAGRASGLGSRYMYVLNAAADQALRASHDPAAATRSRGLASDLDHLFRSTDPITGRTGFDLAAPFHTIQAGDDGVRTVSIPASGRLELHLGRADRGYLSANGSLRDLPAGSNLDAATGVFTWAPGLGFLGTYRLVFLNGPTQIPVDVVLQPEVASDGHSEIRLHVDTPTASQEVARTFQVAGWAFDPKAFTGSGIGAVHVWARRMDVPTVGASFVGEARLGVDRPDVGAAFGPGAARAGYALVATLEPGVYAVTVYAWNVRTSRWEDARTVAVTVRR